jgi:hypothetical protein
VYDPAMPITLARRLLIVPVLLALVVSSGCLEFERAITLNKNLSGKATFRMTMNMEAMARFGVQMDHQMSGKPGEVTEEEIAAAIKEMSAGMAAQQPTEDLKAKVGPLPPGFTLIDTSQKLDGLKMIVSVTIGFDDVRKLPSFKMADPSPNAMSANDQIQPFEGIEVKDEGSTLLITAKLLTTGDSKMMAPGPAAPGEKPAPAEGLTDMFNGMLGPMGGDAGLKALVDGMMKGMKETFRLETPMTVVDTNATKREPGAVVWEQSLEALDKAKTASPNWKSPVMTVRVKK